MKTEVNKSQFMDAFNDCGRGEQFSYNGKSALYDWLEDMSEQTGEEYSLDVIALCCEFSEYESAIDCVETQGYDCDFSDCEDDDCKEECATEYLNDNTFLIEFESGVIIQDF